MKTIKFLPTCTKCGKLLSPFYDAGERHCGWCRDEISTQEAMNRRLQHKENIALLNYYYSLPPYQGE